jgi:hypothetical protein
MFFYFLEHVRPDLRCFATFIEPPQAAMPKALYQVRV